MICRRDGKGISVKGAKGMRGKVEGMKEGEG
jgi:hypothetical protein